MTTARSRRSAQRALDRRVSKLRSEDALATPRGGWVRGIRDALGMSAAELGRRMEVTHSAVFDLERNEKAGTARLDTLRRAAHAMDCDLVYAFVPRHGLEATVRKRAEELADEDLAHVQRSMDLENQGVPADLELREEVVRHLSESRNLWSRR